MVLNGEDNSQNVQLTIEIGTDNKCSMHLLEQVTRSFLRAKHIKVSYFWLKDLSKEEEMVLNAITGAKFK